MKRQTKYKHISEKLMLSQKKAMDQSSTVATPFVP